MTSVITDFVLMLSASFGLSILFKATAILLLGFVAGMLAARAAASWRHLVFATTFVAVLALPLVSLSLPEFPVEFAVASQEEVTLQSTASTVSADDTTIPPSIISSSTPVTSGSSLPSVATVLLLTWTVGTALLMFLLIVDLLRIRQVRRHGLPSARLREMVEHLASDTRSNSIAVMLHEKIKAPVTFGFFRPVIMLPLDAEDWSEADLQRALVHELEHIRRGDWATQLAARTACAVYWFHPLIWMAWRKLCLEAERACDDAVVQTAESTEYAEQLVSLSRQLTAVRSQPMLGMAKRSDLARRISSVLDTTLGRGRASLAAAVFAVCVGLTVVIAIGPLRAVAQVATSPAPEKQTARVDLDKDDDDDDDRNSLDEALFKAAERNQMERIRPLIEQGANVNAILQGDGTALIAAARQGHLEMVRLLLDSGAKPNIGVTGDGNALQNAAQKGHREVVILLLDRGADIDAGVEGDGNALIMASGAGHIDVVTLLLDRGANIHKVVAGDENPIIKAAEQGQLDVIKLLIARGADINSRVRFEFRNGTKVVEEYRTPLSQARKNGHTAVIEYLLSAGARQ